MVEENIVEETIIEEGKTVLELPNYIEVVSKELGFKDFQVSVVLELIAE
jgi:hypothetical protein